MEIKYAPGPWKVEHLTVRHDHPLSKKMPIAHVVWGGMDIECAKSNAHLISAGPELLEACKTLVDSWNDAPEHFRNRYGNIIDSAVGMAREAIAKAEGKEVER